MKIKMTKMLKMITMSVVALSMVVAGTLSATVDSKAETVSSVESAANYAASLNIKHISDNAATPSFITKQAYSAGSTITFDYYIEDGGKIGTWWNISWTTSNTNADIYKFASNQSDANGSGKALKMSTGTWETETITLPVDQADEYYFFFAGSPGEWDTEIHIDNFTITSGDTTVKDDFNNGLENGLFNVNPNGEKAVSRSLVDGVEGVIYVQYENMDYHAYWETKAPVYTEVQDNGVGYLFGGWYAKNDNKYSPIEKEADLDTATVVAKFVPAQTMSVKCQNWAGTDKDSNDVIIRVISATDSLNYAHFGFVVSKIVNGKESTLQTVVKDTVYKKFNYYEDANDTEPTPYVPSDLFGESATRFTTCTVGKIPTAHHGTIICIKPFWETLDGTTVYGLSKFAHVEDGYLGYVNVPVNINLLTEDSGAAAGILSVTAPANSGLTFIGAEEGVECGKVFDEMEFNVLSDGTIKCAGNTSDVSDKTEIDIYINLKFQKEQTNDAPTKGEFYTFTVGDENFANSDEKDLENQDVWNVIY